MKKILLAATILLGVVVLPSLAMAHWADDNFDDGILNTNLWEVFVGDPLNRTMLVEQNGRLEWLTGYDSGFDAYDASRNYASKWSLALSNDFELSFMGNAAGNTLQGLQFGLLGEHLGVNPVWQGRLSDSGGEDVAMYFSYNTQGDMLTFSTDNISRISAHVGGLRAGGNNYLKIYLGGYSLLSLGGGTAYFDNFQINKGVVTPEPLSCTLFLLGGAALALVRRKNRGW